MLRKDLIVAALMAIGASSIAGGAFAADECALASSLNRAECENPLREERWRERCYKCRWEAPGQTRCSRNENSDDCNSGILQFRARGAHVEGLQGLLKSKGFDVEVTGIFDERTKKAVESFQKQQNIYKDGRVGPETLGKLLKTDQPGNIK